MTIFQCDSLAGKKFSLLTILTPSSPPPTSTRTWVRVPLIWARSSIQTRARYAFVYILEKRAYRWNHKQILIHTGSLCFPSKDMTITKKKHTLSSNYIIANILHYFVILILNMFLNYFRCEYKVCFMSMVNLLSYIMVYWNQSWPALAFCWLHLPDNSYLSFWITVYLQILVVNV